ncbi:MAG: hypothetical protein ACI4D4_07580 [Lachnospira sp.]
MKFLKIVMLVLAMAFTFILVSVESKAETQTQTEITNDVSNDPDLEETEISSSNFEKAYLIILLSGIVGCLVALGMWLMWR